MNKRTIGLALTVSLLPINSHAFPDLQPVDIFSEAGLQRFLATLPEEDFFIQKLTERIVACECEGAEMWAVMATYYNDLLDYYGFSYGKTLRTFATASAELDQSSQADVMLANMWYHYGINDLFMPVFALIEEEEAYRLVDSGVLTSEQLYTADMLASE